MKLKFIAALLGLIIAIPGAVIAQNQDDQVPDQNSKPSPNIQMQGPNDQTSTDQDADQDAAARRAAANGNPSGQTSDQTSDQPSGQPAMTPGPMDPGPNSNDANSSSPSYNTPAPEMESDSLKTCAVP